MERIMKLFLKRKIVCSFELIYNHGLVSGITSLSVFTEDTLKPSFSWACRVFGFEKCFCFHQNICFSFFANGACKSQKDVNVVLHMKKRLFFKIKPESFKLPKSMFSRIEISMVFIELFVVFLNGIFSCDKVEC